MPAVLLSTVRSFVISGLLFDVSQKRAIEGGNEVPRAKLALLGLGSTLLNQDFQTR